MEIRNISKSFNSKCILNDISFSFNSAETTGIVGPSGCGKTTLINIILGLERPDSGSVIFPSSWRIGCVFQEDRLVEHLNAFKNVAIVAHSSVSAKDIYDGFKALGLDPQNGDPVSKYSGGMRRRVAIARAVFAIPDLLILDEPFKGLDDTARIRAAQFIMAFCRDACRILVTHDDRELAIMNVQSKLVLSNNSI